MSFRRMLLVCAVALGVTAFAPGFDGGAWTGEAAAKTQKSSAKKKSSRTSKSSSRKARLARQGVRSNDTSGRIKQCTEVTVKTGKGGKKTRKKRRCSFVREFQGHGVGTASLRKEPLERPSGDIWLSAENLREETRVNIYKPDGTYDEAALAKLDELFRCKRTGEVRSVDPRLYEQLSRIYDHFGGKRVDLVSGFRFAERNSSRHYHASAMDIRIQGVTIKEMYAYAESLDAGGMGIGIYPHSGFVHVDFRAPGEPSYRWTDYSGPDSGRKGSKAKKSKSKKKSPGRTSRAKKPTS